MFNCSSDDSDSDNDFEQFLEITVLGQTYTTDNEFSFSSTQDDCNSSNILIFQSLGQIDNAELFIDVFLLHQEVGSDFNSNIAESPRLLSQTNLSCYLDFDFVVSFFSETLGTLELDASGNNVNTITDISLLRELNQENVYAVNGQFEATFIDNSGNPIPTTGRYRSEIYILN